MTCSNKVRTGVNFYDDTSHLAMAYMVLNYQKCATPGPASSEVERSLCKSFFSGDLSSDPARGHQEFFACKFLHEACPVSSKYFTGFHKVPSTGNEL